MATRDGSARWTGDIPTGAGEVTVGSATWTGPYSFASRFEDGSGTNPEELIAAAHAGCFSMALTHMLDHAGHPPRRVETTARVHLRMVDGAPTIARIELDTEGDVPSLDEDGFREFAEKAKADCPVSRALGAVGEMEVTARLVS